MAGDRHAGGTSFVAIDIGKAFHAVLVEFPDGAHQRFRMANSAEDYGRWWPSSAPSRARSG